MKIVGTTEAAFLLGISVSRLRILLKENRVKDAKKVGRVWVIPLFKGVPKVQDCDRGPKGKWRKKKATVPNYIHINKNAITSNKKHNTYKPVITIKQGTGKQRNTYCHYVDVQGPCRVVYRPDQEKACGATVWIEVAPNIPLMPKVFNSSLEYQAMENMVRAIF
ncbi:MAG: DNA-binding protein [Xenococcus sp. (in: cyanobacteria)]